MNVTTAHALTEMTSRAETAVTAIGLTAMMITVSVDPCTTGISVHLIDATVDAATAVAQRAAVDTPTVEHIPPDATHPHGRFTVSGITADGVRVTIFADHHLAGEVGR